MLLLNLINNFYDAIDLFNSHDTLIEAISQICKIAGFDYFAIMQHAHLDASRADVLRIHNYPPDFAAYHEAQGLGVRDPVHRASQLRGTGFGWSGLSRLLSLTKSDHHVLDMARSAGIGDGYTVPFHVPGERSGSCSFAVRSDGSFPHLYIPLAQSLGSFAFEAALNLQRLSAQSLGSQRLILPIGRARARIRLAPLTEREREIVVWLGHGKQEKEIARILGISPSTVNDHLKHARARCGVRKSALLVVCALLTGSITYNELLAI